MRMRGIGLSLWGIVLLLASAACSRKEEVAGVEDDSVSVELAFSLEGNVSTRASVSAISELANESSFRGMENIRIIPFATRGEIGPEDVSIGYSRRLPSISSSMDDAAYSGNVYHKGLIRNNHAHLYPSASAALPEGTASVLVYGSGIHVASGDTPRDKHLNGSLIETGWEVSTPDRPASAWTFSPDPIYSGGIPASASVLTDILTHIASSVTYTQTYYYQRNGVWHEGHIAATWDDGLAETVLRGRADDRCRPERGVSALHAVWSSAPVRKR